MKQKLTVFAAQRQALPVLPSTIVDFGAIVPDGTSARVVRIREVETIRFNLVDVDVSDMPLTHTISRSIDQAGMATYRITLELRSSNTRAGSYAGTCTLFTTSRTHPQVRVPVQYEILPTLTVEPANLTIGTIGINMPHTQVFQIRSALPGMLHVEVVKQPKECSVRENRGSACLELNVTTTLTTPGVWQDEIGLKINSESGSQDVTIRCTGLAK